MHLTIPSMKKERIIERAVGERTSDSTAVLQDLPRGQNQVAEAFPVPPNFDALSEFVLQWHADRHLALSIVVKEVRPWTFADVTKSAAADVVAFGLRYYAAHYAPDSSDAPIGVTHITMRPFQFVVNETPKNDMFLNDIYIDNTTGLPTRIRMTGNDDLTFILDYAMIQGHWLVNHAHFEQTIYGPLHIGAIHYITEAAYDQFTFPAAAPDPRLATPAPAITPTPTAAPAATPLPVPVFPPTAR
jgi:hypothetical protein